MFEPKEIKALWASCSQLGNICGMAEWGEISEEDFQDYVQNAHFRQELTALFSAAEARVGREKALRSAIKEARMYADIYLTVRHAPGGPRQRGGERAERAVKSMLL